MQPRIRGNENTERYGIIIIIWTTATTPNNPRKAKAGACSGLYGYRSNGAYPSCFWVDDIVKNWCKWVKRATNEETMLRRALLFLKSNKLQMKE